MIGRRTVIGLSLLSALVFCAFAVQTASAAETESKRTTVVTCVDTSPTNNGDFEDEHCDKRGFPGKGRYRHDGIKVGETKKIVNDPEVTAGKKEAAFLKGNIGLTKTEISCETFTTDETKSWVENSEPAAKDHKVTGKARKLFGKCTVKKPEKCTLKEPVVSEATIRGVEGLKDPKSGKETAMGLRFKGEGAEDTFAEITYEGAECALKNQTFPIKGTVIATSGPGKEEGQENAWSGATLVFTPKFSMQKLQIGKPETNKAEFETIDTARIYSGSPLSPLSMTTFT